MIRLTAAERKVLAELENNARMPANQIAKRCRLSPEGVIKIINRLQENRLIVKFNTKINYDRLGYTLYPIQMKLERVDKEAVTQIRDVIRKHKSCVWHLFYEGEYDLLVSFRVRTETDRTDMTDMLLEISDMVSEKDVSIALDAYENGMTFTDKNTKTFKVCERGADVAVLDETDMKLLEMLKKDCRQTATQMASVLGVDPRTVASRIRWLEQERIISGYTLRINTSLLNYHDYRVLLRLGKCTRKDLKSLRTYCEMTPNIRYWIRQVGNYDVELALHATDVRESYAIIDEIREKFPFVKKISTLITKHD